AEDGSHVWSDRFDRELTDVFAIQDEVAQSITTALSVKLSPETPASHRYTPNLQAYDAFLKARRFFKKVTPEAITRSIDFCEQAIALDPGFGRAYIALGDCLIGLAFFFPAREIIPKIRAAAERALEIDSSFQEAHGLLGCVAAVFDYNWTEA